MGSRWLSKVRGMNESGVSPNPSPAVVPVVIAAVLDVVFVVAFAAMGRVEHGGEIALFALWQAAWPFLLGLGMSWAAARVWRAPAAPLRSGLVLWIGTVTIGMITRVLFTEGGAAIPFVLVAAGVLGVTLIGWRLIAVLIRRIRSRSGTVE